MDSSTSLKRVLWLNVSTLMKKHYKRENLSQLATDAGVGLASIDRIKKMQTSVGLDIVEAVAGAFKMQPWQLLVPALDADNPPELAVMSENERELYARIRDAAKLIVAEPKPKPYIDDKED